MVLNRLFPPTTALKIDSLPIPGLTTGLKYKNNNQALTERPKPIVKLKIKSNGKNQKQTNDAPDYWKSNPERRLNVYNGRGRLRVWVGT